jgi:hypothetical protein
MPIDFAHVELRLVIGDDAVHGIDLGEHGVGIPTEEVTQKVFHRLQVLLLGQPQ